MRLPKFLAAILALAASALAAPAGASTFEPTAPLPFELVNLRMTVDSCAFNPSTFVVVTTTSAIQVLLPSYQYSRSAAPLPR